MKEIRQITPEDLRTAHVRGTSEQMAVIAALNEALANGSRVNVREIMRRTRCFGAYSMIRKLRIHDIPLPPYKVGEVRERLRQAGQLVLPRETDREAARRHKVSLRTLRASKLNLGQTKPHLPPEERLKIEAIIAALVEANPDMKPRQLGEKLKEMGYPLSKDRRRNYIQRVLLMDPNAHQQLLSHAIGIIGQIIPPTSSEELREVDLSAGQRARDFLERRTRESNQNVPSVQGGVNPTEPIFGMGQNDNPNE